MASEALLSLWSPAKKLGILGVLEDLVGIAIGLIGLLASTCQFGRKLR